MGDDLKEDLELEKVEGQEYTWAELRAYADQMSERIQEWQGIPMPIPDMKVILHDQHPYKDSINTVFKPPPPEINITIGGPETGEPLFETREELLTYLSERIFEDNSELLVNRWYSKEKQAMIYVYQKDGKAFSARTPMSTDRSHDRAWLAIRTIGACDAWDLDAEYAAQDKLRAMLRPHNWRQYELTGTFLEESPRSHITYMFRRLRPTIALSPRNKPGALRDNMRIIATLCMHPIGYYDKTFAGCMVPTDDVIAHLTYMRGDEADYWAKANQHQPHHPEAGI